MCAERTQTVQKTELVMGWIEGLQPEQHWRLMVLALTVLFLVGVVIGVMDTRDATARSEARVGPGVTVEARL